MAHNVAGTLLLIGCGVHIALHRKWIKGVVLRPPREMTGQLHAKRAVNIWLFVFYALCGITGPIAWITQELLSNPFLLSLEAWGGLHKLTGMLMFLILLVHLGMRVKLGVRKRKRQTEEIPA